MEHLIWGMSSWSPSHCHFSYEDSMIVEHFLHRYRKDGRCSQPGHAPCPRLLRLYVTHLLIHRRQRLHPNSDHSSADCCSEPPTHHQASAHFSLMIWSCCVARALRHRIAISIILAYLFCSNQCFLLVWSIRTPDLLSAPQFSFGHSKVLSWYRLCWSFRFEPHVFPRQLLVCASGFHLGKIVD